VDHQAVADLLGLDVQAMRLKIGFPAPEVLAATDPEPAREMADRLHATGLRVASFDGSELSALPWPELVSSFYFDEDALTARVGDEAVVVPYDAPVTIVYYKPPPDFQGPGEDAVSAARTAGRGRVLAEAIQFMAGADVYVPHAAGMRRVCFVSGPTDFGGLGERQGSGPAQNLELMVAELSRRFENGVVDTRLENVRPRRKFAMGDDSFDLDMRKLFSFGTLLLRQALMAVDPELGDLPQYELGSRVACVLNSMESGI
jgi:hypothetical protein